jgi:hypothetical protein
MSDEASLAVLREALEATLQSHQRFGKAAPCDCSLCKQIRDALAPQAGATFRKRVQEECAGVADWTAQQLVARSGGSGNPETQLAIRTAREIAGRIRVLDAISL